MDPKKIAIAADEAKRFLKRFNDYKENPPDYRFVGTKETSALRRSSMDLTRALSDMRKSQ